MLQPVIDMISDFATLLAQGAVGFIAERSHLRKDGVLLFMLKVAVSMLVYLAIIVGIPLAALLLIVKIALPVIFS